MSAAQRRMSVRRFSVAPTKLQGLMNEERHMSIRRGREESVVLSAPPLQAMTAFYCYEGTTYDATTVPPPPVTGPRITPTPSEFSKNVDNLKVLAFNLEPLLNRSGMSLHISEEEARAALSSHVDNHCCYGNRAAREMALTKILYSSTFHYKLETFTEKRQIAWAFEPCSVDVSWIVGTEIYVMSYDPLVTSVTTGSEYENVEATSSIPPPLPWDVEVTEPSPFSNHVFYTEIPRTSSVKVCHTCLGTGQTADPLCHGQGQVKCTHCHGDGHIVETSGYRAHCSYCQGRGREKCLKCSGLGFHPCKVCASHGHLRCFIRLTVTWTNHVDEHVSEKTDLPSKLITKVSGHLVLDDQQPMVCPISHFPDVTVNAASEQLIRHHAHKWKEERVLLQRHQVRLVPVHEIHYEWRDRPNKFYVYGYERALYVPDYPQTCCWGFGECVIA